MATSFQRLAELEAALEMQKTKHASDLQELREALKEAVEKIQQLMVILETLESLAKLAKMLEGAAIWFAKLAGAVALMYGIYKFGLVEIAEKVKSIGGK